MSLQDKVAIVTGGSGGIGQVLVRGLLEAGAVVAHFDIDEVRTDQFSKQLRNDGYADRSLAIVGDLADPDACDAAVSQAVSSFGGVHILINNGGLGMGVIRSDHMTNLVKIHEITPEMWQRFAAVNLNGAFYMTRATVPHLFAQNWGRIINVTTSYYTMLRSSFHPYGPCKAGFEAMSCGHAREFQGTGVTVNVVVPGGPADTPMVPQEAGFKRSELIAPSAMVPPVLWLCSDEANDTTGTRYVAAEWDARLSPGEAARRLATPIGWPDLAENPVWPGGRPDH